MLNDAAHYVASRVGLLLKLLTVVSKAKEMLFMFPVISGEFPKQQNPPEFNEGKRSSCPDIMSMTEDGEPGPPSSSVRLYF